MFLELNERRQGGSADRFAAQSRRLAIALSICGAFATLAAAPTISHAEGKPEDEASAASARRLAIMQSAIDDFTASSQTIAKPAALKFAPRPLLRYSDETRGEATQTTGALDAAVWRLGGEGRPTALVTLEIDRRRQGGHQLIYEFVSLAPSPFELKSARGPKWIAPYSELKIVPLEDGPAPADSPRARLTQMRKLARRFTTQEQIESDTIECRLLSQPIDRYEDQPAGIQDGAMFVFANGTNPELGLLLECSGERWSYGMFRLSAAALFAHLDGKLVFEAPRVVQDPVSAPYTAVWHPIDLQE